MTESHLAITTGSANLLYVRLDVFRHVEMHDAADVGLVETHAERHRCDDDAKSPGHEVFLDVLACDGRHAGMVALRIPAAASLLLLRLGLLLSWT